MKTQEQNPFNYLKYIKQITASITLAAFLMTTFGQDLAQAVEKSSLYPSQNNEVTSNPQVIKDPDLNTISIPAELGIIEETFFCPASEYRRTKISTPSTSQDIQTGETCGKIIPKQQKIVIHIQDAHCNYSAQQKISGIIKYLAQKYGINTINLEGGTGKYDLSVFTDIKDTAVRYKVSDFFLKQGVISGAEQFSINDSGKVDLWGIENTELYLKNRNVYRHFQENKNIADNYLKDLELKLAVLKEKIYSKELLAFDRACILYKQGKLSLEEYVAECVRTAEANSISLKGFNNIDALYQTFDYEAGIDFKRANIERDVLVDSLEKILSRVELEELVIKILDFKESKITHKEFYSYIFRKAAGSGLDFAKFQNFTKYLRYINVYENINIKELTAELEVFETRLKENFFENNRQKELDRLYKNLIVMKNLFSATLTRKDYEFYKKKKQEFDLQNYVDFIEETAHLLGNEISLDKDIFILDHLQEEILEFYKYSFKRDEVFLKNIKFSFPYQGGAGPSPTNNQRLTTILITGGFHAENLHRLFREKNISYISITPNFKNDETLKNPYFDLLSGHNSGLAGYLSLKAANLAIYSYLCSEESLRVYGLAMEDLDLMVEAIKRLFSDNKEPVKFLGGSFYLIASNEEPEHMGRIIEKIPDAFVDNKQVWAVWEGTGSRFKVRGSGEQENVIGSPSGDGSYGRMCVGGVSDPEQKGKRKKQASRKTHEFTPQQKEFLKKELEKLAQDLAEEGDKEKIIQGFMEKLRPYTFRKSCRDFAAASLFSFLIGLDTFLLYFTMHSIAFRELPFQYAGVILYGFFFVMIIYYLMSTIGCFVDSSWSFFRGGIYLSNHKDFSVFRSDFIVKILNNISGLDKNLIYVKVPALKTGSFRKALKRSFKRHLEATGSLCSKSIGKIPAKGKWLRWLRKKKTRDKNSSKSLFKSIFISILLYFFGFSLIWVPGGYVCVSKYTGKHLEKFRPQQGQEVTIIGHTHEDRNVLKRYLELGPECHITGMEQIVSLPQYVGMIGLFSIYSGQKLQEDWKKLIWGTDIICQKKGAKNIYFKKSYYSNTPPHEIAHHLYYEIFSQELRDQWEKLYEKSTKDTDFVSDYARKNAEEDFAETYANYMTDSLNLLTNADGKLLEKAMFVGRLFIKRDMVKNATFLQLYCLNKKNGQKDTFDYSQIIPITVMLPYRVNEDPCKDAKGFVDIVKSEIESVGGVKKIGAINEARRNVDDFCKKYPDIKLSVSLWVIENYHIPTLLSDIEKALTMARYVKNMEMKITASRSDENELKVEVGTRTIVLGFTPGTPELQKALKKAIERAMFKHKDKSLIVAQSGEGNKDQKGLMQTQTTGRRGPEDSRYMKWVLPAAKQAANFVIPLNLASACAESLTPRIVSKNNISQKTTLQDKVYVTDLLKSSKWVRVQAPNTRGVYDVANRDDGGLDLLCNLFVINDERSSGKVSPFIQGEAVLDLRYASFTSSNGTAINGLYDMTEGMVKVEVEVPQKVIGPDYARSGFQVAVSSENGSQYSKWQNAVPGIMTIVFYPSEKGKKGEYTTSGFDPSKVMEIKIKVALNSNAPLDSSYYGTIKVKSLEFMGKKAEFPVPEIFPVSPAPIVSEHKRQKPIFVKKPLLRDFLEWSGISGYTNPWVYGGDILSDDGFNGLSGDILEEQYQGLSIIRNIVKHRFPELGDFAFTDRRFYFGDFSIGLKKDSDGKFWIDHELAKENILAHIKLAKKYNIKPVPVIFDYTFFAKYPEIILDPQKRKEIIALISPELKLLGGYKNIIAAIEPVNEPDVDYNEGEKYLVTGIDPGTGKRIYVPLYRRQEFVAELADAIRKHAHMPVSFSAVSRESTKFWMHLYKKGDLVNIHYYEKESYTADAVKEERGLSGATSGRGWLRISEDNQVIYGEYQPSSKEGKPLIGDILMQIRQNAYDGGLFWWVEKDFGVRYTGCLQEYLQTIVRLAKAEGFKENTFSDLTDNKQLDLFTRKSPPGKPKITAVSAAPKILSQADDQAIMTSSPSVKEIIEDKSKGLLWKININVPESEFKGTDRLGKIKFDFNAKKYAGKQNAVFYLYLEQKFIPNKVTMRLVRSNSDGSVTPVSDEQGEWTYPRLSNKWRSFVFNLPKDGLSNVYLEIFFDCWNQPVIGEAIKITTDNPGSNGGAWWGNPLYMLCFAWWFEPMISFWLADFVTVILSISKGWSFVPAALIFWGLHYWRGNDVLFDRTITRLTYGTFIAGMFLKILGRWNFLTVTFFCILTVYHMIVNYEAVKIRRVSDKKLRFSDLKNNIAQDFMDKISQTDADKLKDDIFNSRIISLAHELYEMEMMQGLSLWKIKRRFRKKYSKKYSDLALNFDLSKIGLWKEGTIRYYPFFAEKNEYVIRIFNNGDEEYLTRAKILDYGTFEDELSYQIISGMDFRKIVKMQNLSLKIYSYTLAGLALVSIILTGIRNVSSVSKISLFANIGYFLKLNFLIIYIASLALLFVFCMHGFFRAKQVKEYVGKTPVPDGMFKDLPKVTIQLPIYNELNVVERLIESACAVDYPKDRLEIQVLDDSTDQTACFCGKIVENKKRDGYNIKYIHRSNRIGYKAGALLHATRSAEGEFVAIFDADFIVPADFLKRTIHYFVDPKIAMVQGLWGFINENESFLTKSQMFYLAYTQMIDQTVKNRKGFFMNFQGTGGIWRKKTIEELGGWEFDTVIEDADLSYKAQIKGYKMVHLDNLVSFSELPRSITAFKSQQSRWEKGTVQVLRKVLAEIWEKKIDFRNKFEITVRLTRPLLNIPMFIIYVFLLPALIVSESIGIGFFIKLFMILNFVFMSYFTWNMYKQTYIRYNKEEYQRSHFFEKLRNYIIMQALGVAMVLVRGKAVLEGVFGRRAVFIRTPKEGEVSSGKKKKYKGIQDKISAVGEIFMGVYLLFLGCFFFVGGSFIGPFVSFCYAVAFLSLGFGTFKEKIKGRSRGGSREVLHLEKLVKQIKPPTQ
ncbi:MAG: glycosyltransferase, partial [Candidatus Omnitrophota bacterium]